ncbi:hypothetical protein, partial [Mycobacteroides abscessus]|uniref:hypothetical protein n=1 Tax=Mycobacteroides abscessus TaxID=36809 RepID=UPI0009A67E2D
PNHRPTAADRSTPSIMKSHFEATRDANGVIQSARHRRVRGRAPEADSPEDLLSWSVSVQEFADRFGPATLNYSSAFSEKVLPAHEHDKFEWNPHPTIPASA